MSIDFDTAILKKEPVPVTQICNDAIEKILSQKSNLVSALLSIYTLLSFNSDGLSLEEISSKLNLDINIISEAIEILKLLNLI